MTPMSFGKAKIMSFSCCEIMKSPFGPYIATTVTYSVAELKPKLPKDSMWFCHPRADGCNAAASSASSSLRRRATHREASYQPPPISLLRQSDENRDLKPERKAEPVRSTYIHGTVRNTGSTRDPFPYATRRRSDGVCSEQEGPARGVDPNSRRR